MEDLIYGFKILVIGMSVVYIALIAVALMLVLFGYIDQWLNQRAALKLAEIGPESSHSDEIPPEILAAIFAAVTVAIGPNVHLKRVQLHRGRQQSDAWQTQGRTSIMTSHALQQKSPR